MGIEGYPPYKGLTNSWMLTHCFSNMKYCSFFTQILLCLCFLLYPSNSSANSGDIEDNSMLLAPLGINAHLLFNCSNLHMNELCQSMAKAGVGIVRLDLYWSDKNMTFQQDLCDKAIYYIQKYGMEVELNIPQIPLNRSDAYLENWAKTISYYAKRYDGSTLVKPNEKEPAKTVKVKYFEIMNEPEFQEKNGLTPEMFFKMIRMSSSAVRSVRSDSVFMVLPGLCAQNKFDKDLLAYIDEDGKSVADYIDILNPHFYIDKQSMLYENLLIWKNIFRKNAQYASKPIWVTEYGHSLWNFSEKRQAVLLPRQALASLAMGFDKAFYYQFHQYGGNFFGDRNQREDFFGIIDTSIKNSYGSLFRNDGRFRRALTQGDGSRRIYLTDKTGGHFSLYTLTDSVCKELREHGVAIGGMGYSIDSVILMKSPNVKKVLYKGYFKIPNKTNRKCLILPHHFFAEVELTDKLVVYTSEVKNLTGDWMGVKPLEAYTAYQILAKRLEGATRPIWLKDLGKVVGVRWTVDGKWHYALWTNEDVQAELKIENYDKSIKCYSYLGKIVKLKHHNIKVDSGLTYIYSDLELKFQIL